MPENKVIPVKVAVRCRPLVPKEQNEGCQCCVTFIPGEPQLVLGRDRAFTYDYVFSPASSQESVYIDSVQDLVKGLFKGYNATVLAYGQTGSGKTHSMGGGYNVGLGQEEEDMGIIPRVIRDIFEGITLRQESYDFTVKVSYLEIYKEELGDLLVPVGQRDKDLLAVREDTQGCLYIAGLKEEEVGNFAATMNCLENGSHGRTVGSTAMNNQSSRSHAIFTISVERNSKTDSNDSCKAKFHLVDLAGSERAKKTHAEGERFKEGVNINRGLLALGNVISALGDEQQKRTHIPYRDSKLTRLLQDSLGGNSHTVMIACISPADSNMEETLSTLRYADRARKIKNKPIVNRDPQAAEIMRLKALVQELQMQVIQGGGAPKEHISRSSLDSSVDLEVMKNVIKGLEEETGKLKSELINAIHQNTKMCEKVVALETANDRLQESLESLKEKTGLSLSTLAANPEMEEKLKEIHTALEHMESIHQSKLETSSQDDSGSSTTEMEQDMMQVTTEDLLKEAQLKNKMFALNDELLHKEELLRELRSNDTTFSAVHEKYKAELKALQEQIEALTKEKDELCNKLQAVKASSNSSKVSEQRRQRLKELEKKLAEIQKAHVEQSKMLRMKEAASKDCARLDLEIKNLKKQRVTLMKQMRTESEASRKWKMQKEKEVMQLKAKERKQAAQVTKLERQHQHQQGVLKRKAEEAIAANRRLKDALAKQRQVAADRTQKQERHDNNNQNKIKKWLDDEMELVTSVEEARHHLAQMINQRKQLNKELHDLKDQLEAPPSKKMLLNDSGSKETDCEKKSILKRKKMVQYDIDLVNNQITETQQRIVEADQDEKAKTRWDSLHNMMEARCTLRLLLDKAVKAQVERLEEVSRAVEAEATAQDAAAQLTAIEAELANLRQDKERQLTNVRQETERKVTYLLNLLNQKALTKEDVKGAENLMKDELEKLAVVQDELEQKNKEVDSLQMELTKANLKAMKGQSSSYFSHLPSTPKFDSPEDRREKRPNAGSFKYSPGTDVEDDDVNDPDWRSGITPGKPIQFRTQKKDGPSVANPRMSILKAHQSTEDVLSGGCSCKSMCGTQRCSCVKAGLVCGDGDCKCNPAKCRNRPTPETESPTQSTLNSTFTMSSAPVETSTEDSSVENTIISTGLKRSSSGVRKKALADGTNLTTGGSMDSSADDFVAPIAIKKKRKLTKSFFTPLQ